MLDNWLQFFILGFASFRLTRLLVFDTIFQFIRNPFHENVVETLPDGSEETYIEIKGTGVRYWIGELLLCHWCTGIWSSTVIFVMYFYLPQISMPVIIILAIAGVASIIQLITDHVGN